MPIRWGGNYCHPHRFANLKLHGLLIPISGGFDQYHTASSCLHVKFVPLSENTKIAMNTRHKLAGVFLGEFRSPVMNSYAVSLSAVQHEVSKHCLWFQPLRWLLASEHRRQRSP